MPHCPQCGRHFATPQSVRAHLNQPYGSCHHHFNELISIAEAIRQPNRQSRSTFLQHQPVPNSDTSSDDENRGHTFRFVDSGDGDVPSNDHVAPADDHSTPSNNGCGSSSDPTSGFIRDVYPESGMVCEQGDSFMDTFNNDNFAEERQENIYYPFASQEEWELASFLLQANISMAMIDKFLALSIVSAELCSPLLSLTLFQIKKLQLSFTTARTLRNRVEMLPSGPRWKSKKLVPKQPTKQPIHLYYRDPLDCIESLLQSLLLADHITYSPFHLYRTAARVARVYTEWLSGDVAWSLQVCDNMPCPFSKGSTILSVLGKDPSQGNITWGNTLIR